MGDPLYDFLSFYLLSNGFLNPVKYTNIISTTSTLLTPRRIPILVH